MYLLYNFLHFFAIHFWKKIQKITKKFKIKCEICERWKNNEICRENDKKDQENVKRKLLTI